VKKRTTKKTLIPPSDPGNDAERRAIDLYRLTDVEKRDTPPTLLAAPEIETLATQPTEPPLADTVVDEAPTDVLARFDDETLGREMYGCYLASNFPEALVLAERVLERAPDHALAQLVIGQCRERLDRGARLQPNSVLRLRISELERRSSYIDAKSSIVLGHVDGVSDAATVAALTGLPDGEAIARLHALLDLGVLEVVNG
jgi:hypothetical protein